MNEKMREKIAKIWNDNTEVVGIKTINGKLYESYVCTNSLFDKLEALITSEKLALLEEMARDDDVVIVSVTDKDGNKMNKDYVEAYNKGVNFANRVVNALIAEIKEREFNAHVEKLKEMIQK